MGLSEHVATQLSYRALEARFATCGEAPAPGTLVVEATALPAQACYVHSWRLLGLDGVPVVDSSRSVQRERRDGDLERVEEAATERVVGLPAGRWLLGLWVKRLHPVDAMTGLPLDPSESGGPDAFGLARIQKIIDIEPGGVTRVSVVARESARIHVCWTGALNEPLRAELEIRKHGSEESWRNLPLRKRDGGAAPPKGFLRQEEWMIAGRSHPRGKYELQLHLFDRDEPIRRSIELKPGEIFEVRFGP